MFDICIPSYNRDKLLSLMIDSIPDSINVHISDNGGCYRENKALNSHHNVTMYPDESIIPMFNNWARAASLSKERFFFLPSDDDIYYPQMKEIVTDILKDIYTNDIDDVSMIVFGHDLIDGNGDKISSWHPAVEGTFVGNESFEQFRFGVDARMPSILINKQKYDEIGGINLALQYTAADSELVQRLALAGKVVFSQKTVSAYRVWPGSETHKTIATEEWSNDIDLWMRNISFLLHKNHYSSRFVNRTTDEIKLRNIVAGVFYCDSIKQMIDFLRINKYPYRATLKTQLRLVYRIMMKVVKK